MEEEMKTKKMGFFTRMKIAIFKLEDYGVFLQEMLKKAIKYILMLILLVSVIQSVMATYRTSQIINKINVYIKNELPEFQYENEKLNFGQVVEAYDQEQDFNFIADTKEELSVETLKQYKDKMKSSTSGLILLSDKLIFFGQGDEIEVTFSELSKTYGILNINNKSELIEILDNNTNSLIGSFFIANIISYFLVNTFGIVSDIIILTLIGLIASLVAGVPFKTRAIVILSIYSVTLSTVILTIVGIINVYTGSYTENISSITFLISCVYLIASIFMIKYDMIKQVQQLQELYEVQKEVQKESENLNDILDVEEKNEKTEEKKENETEEKKSEEPEIELNREPDGSEI